MARSPAAPFWTRASPRRSPGGSRAPATCTKSPGPPGQPARRQACPGRPISCWTGLVVLVTEGRAEAVHPGRSGQRGSLPTKRSLLGAQAGAAPLIEAVTTDARTAGQGGGIQWSQWVSAILYNGLGRYGRALARARQAGEQAPELYTSMWAAAELIEAASRTGQTWLAADALTGLSEARASARPTRGRESMPAAGPAQRRPGRRDLLS